MAAVQGAFLPWASDLGEEAGFILACTMVDINVVIHGGKERIRSVSVPVETTCSDLKGHLAVNGVVSTCDGLEIRLTPDGASLDAQAHLSLTAGQFLHLFRATQMVSVTALVTGSSEEEVYELVLPAEATGAILRERICETTAGALAVTSIFVPGLVGDMVLLGDADTAHLQDDQAICVERATPTVSEATPATQKMGFMSGLMSKMAGRRSRTSAQPGFRVLSASNVKLSGSQLACTSKDAWAGCVVFEVPDPAFFEVSVQLLQDCPSGDRDGLNGRWMLGVVPTVYACTKTPKDRGQLLNGGYFVTVCHGHPAKVRVPSMPRGICGEDLAALPGELRAGQILTMRWAASSSKDVPGALTVQVDSMDAVTVPYAVPPFEEIRPCLVFGGKPTELRVLQLDAAGRVGGA